MKTRDLGVDVLCVFSVTLVVLSHYGLLGGGVGGTHGVVIFFMISGYCMRYSTQGRTGGGSF
jgi:peptidoglycan/LPS O-acetylase OafA/YrhL